MLMCDMCGSGPKKSYKDGFKRDQIICDKGVGKIKILLYSPHYYDLFLSGYSAEPSCGYIVLVKDQYTWYYCSLTCLNYRCSLKKLAKGMCDFDKHDILAQLEKEENSLYGKRITIKASAKTLERDTLLYKDPVEILKQENKLLKEQLCGFQARQTEIIQNLQCDEDKVKETIEKKKQKEIDKLTETLKERDKAMFQMQCRIIELERTI